MQACGNKNVRIKNLQRFVYSVQCAKPRSKVDCLGWIEDVSTGKWEMKKDD